MVVSEGRIKEKADLNRFATRRRFNESHNDNVITIWFV